MDDLQKFIKKISNGVVKYDDPRFINGKIIDRKIRKTILKINKSNWCWTIWSCQGHLNKNYDSLPYITFIVKNQDIFKLLNFIYSTLPDHNNTKFPVASNAHYQVHKGYNDKNFTIISVYWNSYFISKKSYKNKFYQELMNLGNAINHGN